MPVNFENNIIKEEFVGSFSLSMKNGNKEPNYHGRSWKNPIIKENENGYFLVTGEKSGITVIDIDDPIKPHNKKIIKEFKCNNIVKTNKGFHHYYKYTDKFEKNTKSEYLKLDIRNNGGMIYIPPTTYKDDEDDDTIYKYIWVNKGELQEMPDELILYIKQIYAKQEKENKNLSNMINESSKNIKKLDFTAKEKKEIKLNDVDNIEILKELLNHLDESRASDYNKWIGVGYSLKSNDIQYELFDMFSRRCMNKYNKEKNKKIYDNLKKMDCYRNLWVWLKQDNEKKFFELQNELINENFPEDYYFINLDDYESFDLIVFKELFDRDKNIEDIVKFFSFKKDNFKLEKNEEKEVNKDKRLEKFEKSNSFRYFNKFHCRIFRTNTVFRLNYKEGNILMPFSKNFETSMPDCYFSKNNEKRYFINEWLSSSNHNQYDDIIFNPDKNYINKNNYNLFYGFYFDKEIQKRKDNKIDFDLNIIQPYLNHIKHLVNNNIEIYNHFICWIAHIIQKPWIKQPTCYVFYSDKHGVGKNIMINPIMEIFRGYYFKIDRTEQLVDKFNAESLGKLICYADEIKSFKNGETMSNEIKNIISRIEMSVEFKGKDKITNIRDFIHYIFTSNNEQNFYIETSDRRFNLVECTKIVKDSDYFKNLAKIIEDKEFLINLYWYFTQVDLSNYNFNVAYISDYKRKLMNNNMKYPVKFIFNCFDKFNDINKRLKTNKKINKYSKEEIDFLIHMFETKKFISIDDIYDQMTSIENNKDKPKKLDKEKIYDDISEVFQPRKKKINDSDDYDYGFKFADTEIKKIKDIKIIKDKIAVELLDNN